MKRFAQSLLLLLLLPLLIHAQEKVDLEIIHKIKQEGLKNSQIQNISFYLTDYSGARLTGSEGIQRSREWIVDEMKKFGLENVRIESFGEFGKGWNNRKSYIALTSPYYQSFIGTPKAWTPGTDGLQKAEVVLIEIDEESDLEQYKGKLLMNDMKHNAVIVAALVYHTAMRDNLLPRKPLPKQQEEK